MYFILPPTTQTSSRPGALGNSNVRLAFAAPLTVERQNDRLAIQGAKVKVSLIRDPNSRRHVDHNKLDINAEICKQALSPLVELLSIERHFTADRELPEASPHRVDLSVGDRVDLPPAGITVHTPLDVARGDEQRQHPLAQVVPNQELLPRLAARLPNLPQITNIRSHPWLLPMVAPMRLIFIP